MVKIVVQQTTVSGFINTSHMYTSSDLFSPIGLNLVPRAWGSKMRDSGNRNEVSLRSDFTRKQVVNDQSEYNIELLGIELSLFSEGHLKKHLIFLGITVYFAFLSAIKQNLLNDSRNEAFVSSINCGVYPREHICIHTANTHPPHPQLQCSPGT